MAKRSSGKNVITAEGGNGDPDPKLTTAYLMKGMRDRDPDPVFDDPAITQRGSRIEWPAINTKLRQLYISISRFRPLVHSPLLIIETKALLDEEMATCATDDRKAARVFREEQQQQDSLDFGPLLQLLYWRARQQSAIFNEFVHLCKQGHTSYESLVHPIDLVSIPTSVRDVHRLLASFEGPTEEGYIDTDTLTGLHDSNSKSANAPLYWLATLIMRSPKTFRIGPLVHGMLERGLIGKTFKFNEFLECDENTTLYFDSQIGVCEPSPQRPLGFWLPYRGIGRQTGEGILEALKDSLRRFDRIERIFTQWFQISPQQLP